MEKGKKQKKLKIAFVHPDLGIGGAERLVVDAAVGLQNMGHRVTMFCTYHDKKRCFDETRDGTLSVITYGAWIPRNLCGFLHILFSIISMCYCCLRIVLCCYCGKYDVFIVDQVSACIPVLRFFNPSAKIVFYCHFPDKLLAKNRDQWLKRMYRCPFDFVEEITTGLADSVLVNSKFTRKTFRTHFPYLLDINPTVLYPPVNIKSMDEKPADLEKSSALIEKFKGKFVVLSINRFERKKNILLAVQAFVEMKSKLEEQGEKDLFDDCLLVLAGGYDSRLEENRNYMKELQKAVSEFGIESQTMYMKSFSNTDKYVLLRHSSVLIYTPENEHFGIVPVEAQLSRLPVLACNSGGPLESVGHGETGFLLNPKPEKFADALMKLLKNEDVQRDEMGRKGRERVLNMFSLEVFAMRLNDIVMNLMRKKKKVKKED